MRYWRLILASFLLIFHPLCMAEDTALRLATLEYPPYITNTGQGAQGLAVDLVTTAFSRIGQSIKIEFYPIARGQHKLLNGEVDGFFSIKKTPEREQSMLFPQKTLMSQDYVFFVRKDSPWRFTGSFDSLAEAGVGIVSATSYGSRFDSAVQAGAFRKLDMVNNHEANFRKLLAHRVDAVICSRLVGIYYLERLNGLNEVEVSGPPVETTFSYLVFTRKKDYTALSRQFDQSLESMERDGTLKRLINAYLLSQSGIPSR
jgi:polar amino acid transport system substrate-binding protein